MYDISNFLEQYKKLERWAEIKYGEDGVKGIEQFHTNKRIQSDVRYFRGVRNILSHNPNGCENPLIELTDEFKERFEYLCNQLMNNISQISIPYKDIYKREISDKVIPTITHMKEKAFSYVPVMNGKKVWGVFCESTIFDIVGDGEFSLIQEDSQLLMIGKYISEYSENGIFDFIRSDASIDDVRRVFADAADKGRRLDVLYITSTGNKNGDLIGLVTIWDISTL